MDQNPYSEFRPILSSPFEEPQQHYLIKKGEVVQVVEGRRPPLAYQPRLHSKHWDDIPDVLEFCPDYSTHDGSSTPKRGKNKEEDGTRAYELKLVSRIRTRLQEWKAQGFPGASRTTVELLDYWNRPGRNRRLFFAQREAAETIIFLHEARADFLQGLTIPLDEPSEKRKELGFSAFPRYAAKMATGSGKTTVMAMLIAWSVLNKVARHQRPHYTDQVVIVCPNVTIRDRLNELLPSLGEQSLYRKRDLIPESQLASLNRAKILITNWHIFEVQSVQGSAGAKVDKRGERRETVETVQITAKQNKRGRLMTPQAFDALEASGEIEVLNREMDAKGNLVSATIKTVRYVESEASWAARVLDQNGLTHQNVLVINDEAHHAYRLKVDEENDATGKDDEDWYEFSREATVWVEDGLDVINKRRKINLCVDLSATPYYLARGGSEAYLPFPWIVSDFGLADAIESGLVKIPQLPVQDTSDEDPPAYFKLWDWVVKKAALSDPKAKKGDPKPETVLLYAHQAIAMLAERWQADFKSWEAGKCLVHPEDAPGGENLDGSCGMLSRCKNRLRPPVFIIVCKNTKLSQVLYEWIGEDQHEDNVAALGIPELRNVNGALHTIRVDSKVADASESDQARTDELRWMRFTLDTVGMAEWPYSPDKGLVYPEGFAELADKMGKPKTPPGRDVRCIISVAMLTEGWDCNTVQYVVGLRPFGSQLLCEQVAGRALRRVCYELREDGMFQEEYAKVFGIPFEIIPLKGTGKSKPQPPQYHVRAQKQKEALMIECPRVEGFTRFIREKVFVNWDNDLEPLILDPAAIPPESVVKAAIFGADGKPSMDGPGQDDKLDLDTYRQKTRLQAVAFTLATALTKGHFQAGSTAPAHVLFPQFLRIAKRFLETKVQAIPPSTVVDVGLSPYFGWAKDRIRAAIRSDMGDGKTSVVPNFHYNKVASTKDVDFSTSRQPVAFLKCHLSGLIFESDWERQVANRLDGNALVQCFVKSNGLNFTIPYEMDGIKHDYVPDFIVKLGPDEHLLLEVKGQMTILDQIKFEAARDWVDAINGCGQFGKWRFAVAKAIGDVTGILEEAARELVIE